MVEDPVLLGYDVALLDQWFLKFQRNVVLLCSTVEGSGKNWTLRTNSHFQTTQCKNHATKKNPLAVQTSKTGAILYLLTAGCFNLVMYETQKICTFFYSCTFFFSEYKMCQLSKVYSEPPFAMQLLTNHIRSCSWLTDNHTVPPTSVHDISYTH